LQWKSKTTTIDRRRWKRRRRKGRRGKLDYVRVDQQPEVASKVSENKSRPKQNQRSKGKEKVQLNEWVRWRRVQTWKARTMPETVGAENLKMDKKKERERERERVRQGERTKDEDLKSVGWGEQ
jgi:hypothetical protein